MSDSTSIDLDALYYTVSITPPTKHWATLYPYKPQFPIDCETDTV